MSPTTKTSSIEEKRRNKIQRNINRLKCGVITPKLTSFEKRIINEFNICNTRVMVLTKRLQQCSEEQPGYDKGNILVIAHKLEVVRETRNYLEHIVKMYVESKYV